MEGLNGCNQMFLLETRELLRSAELSLLSLHLDSGDYAEQMVLCRSFQAVSVAAASMGLRRVAQIAQDGESCFDDLLERGGVADPQTLQATDALLSALFRELMELVGEDVPTTVEPGREITAPQAAPDGGDAPVLKALVEEPPALPPWWWAIDWSAWKGQGDTPADDAAHTAAAAFTLSIPAAQVQAWADQLRANGHDQAEREGLALQIEGAGRAALACWSAALSQCAMRVASEAGLKADFDLEGACEHADASVLQRLMPSLECWVGLRIGQALGKPLRLSATPHRGGLRLELSDGLAQPWPPQVSQEAWSLVPWLAARGGALRAASGAWQVDIPLSTSSLPLVRVRGSAQGSLDLHLPALWLTEQEPVESSALEAALQAGAMDHQGATWPVAHLGALLRQEPAELRHAQVLWLQVGQQRLALLVDDAGGAAQARPLAWPLPLEALRPRVGLWGAAQTAHGALAVVVDPFQLHDRFGASARVLARSRARRSRR